MVAGPDQALWFINTSGDSIARVTTAGVVSIVAHSPLTTGSNAIAAGPDGAIWTTRSHDDTIDRITTAGVVAVFTSPGMFNPGAALFQSVQAITAGGDGALWFTGGNSYVARITT